ncbi:DUF4158 domain-containing protein [Streptomyces sp. NPDC006197]|uniref:DUF4158 domain-containing protein n=1 Tax=Streptomyces sp. NPDC006197 TaxID=3156685 RepID=UPI0033B7AA38
MIHSAAGVRRKTARLGFALQMCTVRHPGLLLEDPLDLPWPVVERLAARLCRT